MLPWCLELDADHNHHFCSIDGFQITWGVYEGAEFKRSPEVEKPAFMCEGTGWTLETVMISPGWDRMFIKEERGKKEVVSDENCHHSPGRWGMFSGRSNRGADNKKPEGVSTEEKKQRLFLGEDIHRPFKNPFSADVKSTRGFVIGADATPAFLRR